METRNSTVFISENGGKIQRHFFSRVIHMLQSRPQITKAETQKTRKIHLRSQKEKVKQKIAKLSP